MLHCTCMLHAKSKNRRKSGEDGFRPATYSYKNCRNPPGRERAACIFCGAAVWHRLRIVSVPEWIPDTLCPLRSPTRLRMTEVREAPPTSSDGGAASTRLHQVRFQARLGAFESGQITMPASRIRQMVSFA